MSVNCVTLIKKIYENFIILEIIYEKTNTIFSVIIRDKFI